MRIPLTEEQLNYVSAYPPNDFAKAFDDLRAAFSPDEIVCGRLDSSREVKS